MNRSRPSQRQLVKWYLSGAIRWQLKIPEGGLYIIGVKLHYFADRAFHELSVCEGFSGVPGISLTLNGSVQRFVVPARMWHYGIGTRIEKIPGNAVPVDIFFGKD